MDSEHFQVSHNTIAGGRHIRCLFANVDRHLGLLSKTAISKASVGNFFILYETCERFVYSLSQ